MSRSGYIDDFDDQWILIRYRGAVASAIKGARGQALLRDLLGALDAMPQKRLTAWELEKDGEVCALGALGRERRIDMVRLDPECPELVANAFGIACALAREIVYENDEGGAHNETPERRFERMRAWVASKIKEPAALSATVGRSDTALSGKE